MKNLRSVSAAFLFLLVSVFPCFSATHSLSKWEDGKFDLVVSLGWSPTAADKTKLKTVFEIFAKDVWTMTEGNHSLRRLYVYTPNSVTNKARDWTKADIRFLNTADAANATIAGFKKDGRIFIDDDLSDLSEAGHALAHELGHYAYAAYDEYKDDQGPDPGFPNKNDTPKDSIMNQHWTWQNFSVPAHYSDRTKLKTAHYRMYGESIWETLISPVELDSLWGALGYLGYKNARYVFTDLQALKSVPSPLKKPVDNPAVEIIYMEGSEACIIIDDSGSMSIDSKMASAISGAKSYLDKMEAGKDYAAIVAFNSSASTIGSLSLLDNAKKAEFKTSIDALSAGGGTDFHAALSQGYSILSSSTRKGTYKYIVFLSDGEASVPYTVLDQLKDANIPVYAIGLGADADMSAISQIASGTGGKSYYAATSATLNSIYSDISSVSTDDRLTARIKENLNINKNTFSAETVIDSTCKKAVFSSAFPAGESITMELTAPDSSVINKTNIASFNNITLTEEDGYILYEVSEPLAGTWEIDVSASGLTGESEVVIESKTDTDYFINGYATQPAYPEPMLVYASVSRNYPIKGLEVTAQITAPDSTETELSLKDDGNPPDVHAGDGLYTGALADYENGEYQFVFKAQNSDGGAVETSEGVSLKQGTKSVETPVSENFVVMKTASAQTSGKDIYIPNTRPADAKELTVNQQPEPGIIANDEEVLYYYFNASAGTPYTLYTSGLYPDTMKTLVKVYDSNSLETVLHQDSDSMNSSSAKIIFTPQEDGVIYFTVEHGSPGTGTFNIAVRETQATDEQDQPVPEDSDSDKFTCFISVLFE